MSSLAINIHNGGFVRLDAALADDLSVVNSARVSFGKRRDFMDEADVGLINFLMRERHGTPFEHNCFRFHVSCPIFVAREWFRHRVGSFNEYSGRYAHIPTHGYVPDRGHVRTQVGKPGAYTFAGMSTGATEHALGVIQAAYESSYAAYEEMLAAGVAKELARVVIPVGTYTEFWWTVNARSLMNFLSLRSAETAMREIRDYADAVEELFAEQMPVTHRSFVANDRIAP